MTTTAPTRSNHSHRPKRSRRSPGWVPSQHGAWAMLVTPLLVGLLASGPTWTHVPLTAFWFLGYFAFFATGLWLKSHRKARYRPPVLVYSAAAAAAGLLTLLADPTLLRWAPLFVLPLGVGLLASALRDERSLWSGVATTVGSTLMTVVAYDAGAGTDLERAWLLAGILALYFVGTVLYVKTIIRERGSEPYYWLSVGFHGVTTLILIPAAAPLTPVFAALTARAAIVPAFRISPKLAGIGEVVATVVVATTALVAT
ncbi:MAG: YwiC-like family protein [Dermatophilaceae bacterium]